MEFQVFSATLEDRYPPAFTGSRDALLEDLSDIKRIYVERDQPGCVAFVFGRAASGQSVCARIEGVRPKLFFLHEAGDSPATVQNELAREVNERVDVRAVKFSHAYGYERDTATESGRRVHVYYEAGYASLRGWRRASRLRHEERQRELRASLREARTRLADLQASVTVIKSAVLRGNAANIDAARVAERDAEYLRSQVIPGLMTRLDAMQDEQRDEDGNDVAPPRRIRAAQELMVDPMTRFFFESGIEPAGWLHVSGVTPGARVSTCDVELCVQWSDLRAVSRDAVAPYCVLNYDIETLGLDPMAQSVIQISLVFASAGVRERHLVALGSVAHIDGVEVHECGSEQELLHTFRSLVVAKDPDFLVAYNGINFDNQFMETRARVVHADEFLFLSRFALRPARYRDTQLSSSNFGDNRLRYFDAPGRAMFDWFLKLKRDLPQEPKFSLNHFAVKFCGGAKEDVHYKEIPVLQAGSASDRARLGKYCVVDSELLEDLNEARTMIVEILQFAHVFGVLPEWVYFRGQQVRYVVAILHKARSAFADPCLLNRPADGFCGEGIASFKGATVNDPVIGFHREPVIVCDWMALYPSIMRAYNLCFSTHVRDAAMWNTPGIVEYRISDDFVAHFADAATHRGILPRILEELHGRRAAAKRKVKEFLATAKTTPGADGDRARSLAEMYEGRQLALKTSMNSMYGACGATDVGKYPDLAVSATVTLQGRRAMEIKKEILPRAFPGVQIIYGDTDSVMLKFKDVGAIAQCADVGERAATFVTEHFASLGYPDMQLEFEKAYMPYLLQGKKRYAGLKYEPALDGEMVCKGIDCKGIETERKDALPFAKEVMHDCLDALMHHSDERTALARFESSMNRLVRDEIPFDKFLMRKNLSAKAESKADTIVQARVNALRKQREPGSEASTGEQVEYVIVNGHKNEKTTFLAEDPEYARQHALPLNRLWYFEHAIREPVGKLFAPFPELRFPEVCRRYSKLLDGARLRLNTTAISNLLVKRSRE